MISAGSYVLGAAALLAAVVALARASAPSALRRRLLPAWEGAPARLVEAILAVALLIWLAELLGVLRPPLRLGPRRLGSGAGLSRSGRRRPAPRDPRRRRSSGSGRRGPPPPTDPPARALMAAAGDGRR